MTDQVLDFKVEQSEDLPTNIKEQVEQVLADGKKANLVMTTKEKTYLLVALGQRPTGGYDTIITEIKKEGDAVHVYASEMAPPEGSIVTQVLTEPHTIVSISECYDESDIVFHVETAVVADS